MLFSAIRYVIWVSILLLVLSVLSFVILMRDPLNADLVTNNIYSAYYHYLTSLLQGDLGTVSYTHLTLPTKRIV